jgi:glycine cleavage system aminomethyltransferase T/NADPH-dependent 2,4-dienoyl-CoA reductase/sulfur reductase-like enzyme
MQSHRLASGGRIDRTKDFQFSFNGRKLTGHPGDTVASALLANNISLVSRSLKYHRPRGILSAGLEEPNALLGCVDEYGVTVPNLKATEIRLRHGLVVVSQNCWPSLSFDLGSLLRLGSSLMTAGFYYKTFMWPAKGWAKLYERLIRRAAGQGRIAPHTDAKQYDKRYIDCDTLVIGAGPQGIAEAIAAGATGESVMLIDQDQELGGCCLWDNRLIDNMAGDKWLTKHLARLRKKPNIKCKVNTLAFAQYDHNRVSAVEQRSSSPHAIYWRIRARRIIMATGMIEQPRVFAGNDRPGVMLAAAVRHYVYRYAVKPGNTAFLAIAETTERELTRTALEHAGISLAGVLEDGERIVATRGGRRLRGVCIQSKDATKRWLACDLLCVSAGWVPANHLTAHTRKTQTYVARLADADCEDSIDKAFIDLQNDVTRADLAQAVDEGFEQVELLKRYTTVGMGTDQGKTSWPNAITELARLSKSTATDVGQTTIRPPFSPVSLGALIGADVGEHMVPVRYTPFHDAFTQYDCVMQTSGDWLYSRYFPRAGESMTQAIAREVRSVRNHVGCVDMSTLGKVDVKGQDALTFLSRLYCNNIGGLKPGRLRYGLMLREDGMVFDDGTVACLGRDHYLVTMTTANAESVWRWMTKLHQVDWPDLDVQLSRVSDHWASLAIAGPKARDVLAGLAPDFEIDRTSFPFASVRIGALGDDLPCRVFSVSFSGELSYEINVPAGYAEQLFERVMQVGSSYEIAPYGLETLDVLRIEKGHLSVGTEIDGRTTPQDLGLARIVSKTKDFLGAALLQRPALLSDDRLQLVGLVPVEQTNEIPAAAHLTEKPWSAGQTQSPLGRLTAAVYSPSLEHSIALALLQRGQQRLGETLWAVSPVKKCSVEVRVCSTCFYDIEGQRLHV